jgi:hypothetical protein
MSRVERLGRTVGLVAGVAMRLSLGSTIGSEWGCCLVLLGCRNGICSCFCLRSWTLLLGTLGVVAGMNKGLASTFGGGMLGWLVVGWSASWLAAGRGGGWTVIGRCAGWLAIWRGSGCTGGFTGRPPVGWLGSGACGLQFLATTVSLLLSLDVKWIVAASVALVY